MYSCFLIFFSFSFVVFGNLGSETDGIHGHTQKTYKNTISFYLARVRQFCYELHAVTGKKEYYTKQEIENNSYFFRFFFPLSR